MQDETNTSDRPAQPGLFLQSEPERGEVQAGRSAVDFPVAVVLPAAGCGERTGLSTAKQFCPLINRPLICYTIHTFHRISWIKTIVVVVSKENLDLMLHIVHKFHYAKVKVVEGGATRHRSIFSGLRAFSESAEGSSVLLPKVVIIHDAVRPFVEEDFLHQITLAAKEHGASGAVRPLVSTVIATTAEGFLDHSLERVKYRASEMPQAFVYEVIYQAYQRCSEFDLEFGTECLHLALQYSGTNARLLEGPPTLWKVTYKRDLAAAESIVKDTLSLSACLISGVQAESAELASELQKNLAASNMMVDVIPCVKGNSELLSRSWNFIQISSSEGRSSEMMEMVKVFEETEHALLYPVVIVRVDLYVSEESCLRQKTDQQTDIMETAAHLKQENILLYAVQISRSKDPVMWERSVERLSQITAALIKDRNPAFTGQILQA